MNLTLFADVKYYYLNSNASLTSIRVYNRISALETVLGEGFILSVSADISNVHLFSVI